MNRVDSLPKIPFFPAKTLPIFFVLLAALITPKAEAFITAVTPPDWAYMALRGFIGPMLLKSPTTWNQSC